MKRLCEFPLSMSSRLSAQNEFGALVCTGEPAFIALNLSSHSAKTFAEIMKIAALSVSVVIAGSIIVGISTGIKLSTATVWRTETSNAGERDKLVLTEMILHCLSLRFWIQ